MEYPAENSSERSFVDEMTDFDRKDLDLINEKVKLWKYAPYLLRGFVAFAMALLLAFQFTMMRFSLFNLLVPGF